MLKVLYIIAIGLLFAGFVGFGVATFYKAPIEPVIPMESLKPSSNIDDPNFLKHQDDLRQIQKDFVAKRETYNRNLSIIYLVSSIIVVLISIFGLGKLDIIGDGITLGGVILLFVGILSSFNANKDIYSFVAITVGLVVVILLTYWKFLRKQNLQIKV